MSILQEYEWHNIIIGKDKIDAIQAYINNAAKSGSKILYSDVVYKKDEWRKFEDWFENVYNIDYGEGAKRN